MKANYFLSSPDQTQYPVHQLGDQPRVYLVRGFLSHAECDDIIAHGRTRLAPSTVVDNATGACVPDNRRTSQGVFFAYGETPAIAMAEARISHMLGIPVSHGEGVQLLHYRESGQYTPHFDYFDPALPGSATHLRRGGQRIATVITYLNDVPGGGETVFPQLSLKVIPRKGMALVFYNCTPSGVHDPRTLHGGEPVTAGEKWIITKWLRERPFDQENEDEIVFS